MGVFKVCEGIADFIPGISTISNLSELGYKKVNNIGVERLNLDSGAGKEVNVHLVEKSQFESLMGAVPVIGNIYHIVKFIARGFKFRDPLARAIKNRNMEVFNQILDDGKLLKQSNIGELLALGSKSGQFKMVEKLLQKANEKEIKVGVEILKEVMTQHKQAFDENPSFFQLSLVDHIQEAFRKGEEKISRNDQIALEKQFVCAIFQVELGHSTEDAVLDVLERTIKESSYFYDSSESFIKRILFEGAGSVANKRIGDGMQNPFSIEARIRTQFLNS